MQGWASSNWAAACPGSNPAASYAGQTALEIDLSCGDYNGNFVIDWNDTTPFSTGGTLDLDIAFSDASTLADLGFQLQEDSNTATARQPFTTYLATATSGAFTHVTIPVSSLSNGASYLGFVFSFATQAGSVIYLNNVVVSGSGSGTTTGSTGTSSGTTTGSAGSVSFAVDVAAGPARQYQPPSGPTRVSDYVYGINGFGAFVQQQTRWGLIRQGGNAYTDWNWTTNFSNSGADYCFNQNPGAGGANALAGALVDTGDSLPAAQAKGEAYLATVPILDFVSSDLVNNPYGGNPNGPQCPGSSTCGNPYSDNTGNLDFASRNPSSAAFVANHPTKGSALCACPGPSCGSSCTVGHTGAVYQDEFVNYLKVNYGAAGPVFFEMDNEPNYWASTHPEVWGSWTGAVPCQQDQLTTFDDIVTRNVTYAAAVKSAWPQALVFGPVVAQDGVIYARSYTDPHLPTTFTDYYLQQMAQASASAGHPLLDVYDVHWYTSGSNAGSQCVQNPRLFWDPAYTSLSAAQTDAIDFGYSTSEFDTNWYPRKIIPRLLGKISSAYASAGTAAPGLSFSEYNAGCELSIEGGVAEADLLGVFGREGAFAAMAWPLQTVSGNYLVAAYDAYRNYDGQGAVVGDTAIGASTDNVDQSSVYAFAHSGDASAVDLVAINKTSGALTASITLAHAPGLTQAAAYHLVNGSTAVVPAGAVAAPTCAGGTCTFSYTMPAMSVTTLVLR
jgi:mannan endo-1,4-beta-mannosidase